MKRNAVFCRGLFALIGCIFGTTAHAQTVAQGQESAVAVLDTSVLFAIGAREAEQQIRGSFGWPTFQEGFVDGVYFRFDPDGYARFSTSPRLDEDVFEVVCATGSTACAAKKETVEIGLTSGGKVQINFSGITPDDSFFVSDRSAELPLPPTILEPLDVRLETLLAAGGDLIIKRNQEVLQAIPLSGFSAVTTYLRWVAQGQSPRVFPRGWPVPAQSDQMADSGLTAPGQWNSPNSPPQAVSTTFATRQANTQTGFQRQFQNGQFTGQQIGRPAPNATLQTYPQPTVQQWQTVPQQQAIQAQNPQIDALQSTVQSLQDEVMRLRGAGAGAGNAPAVDEVGAFAGQAQGRNLSITSELQAEQLRQSPQAARLPNLTNAPLEFGTTTPSQTEQQSPARAMIPASPRVEMASINRLEQRLYAVEAEVITLRRELLGQLAELRQALAQGQANTHFEILSQRSQMQQGMSPNHSTPQQPAMQPMQGARLPQAAPGASPTVSNLETSLASRLNQAAGLPVEANVQAQGTVMSPERVNLDRSLVEELLKNLDAQTTQDAGVVTQTPSDPAPEMAEETVETEGTESDFISLSDYINQVLKAEENAGAGN